MKTKKSEFIVGFIIIIAVLIVIVGKVIISGTQERSEITEITVQFPQIGGLDVGNSVFIHGVRAGKVADIDLQQDGVVVKLHINKKISMKEDARIVISERGMMGEREISIDPGNSHNKLDVSGILQGQYSVGFNETISEIGVTIQNINKLSQKLEDFIGDDSQTKTIQDVIKNLDVLLVNMNKIFINNEDFTIDFEHINNIISNLDSLISSNDEKVERILTFADDKVPQIERMLSQMQTLLDKLEREDTDIGRLTANDSLYNKINSTIAHFDSLVTDIKENPKHYFRLF
ncbi:MAG: MCE family protein [Candidatus Cloacimonetes bacterium]|nr:MCE family protein [Candidatus Cloacimonadota bacterium]